MSPKPTLSVRSPRNLDDFVNGAKAPDPSALIHQVPAANQVLAADALEEKPLPNHRAPAPGPVAETPVPSTKVSSSVRRPKMRGVVKRADGDERARVTVYLELDVAAKLRRHCFENGLELSDVASEAINGFVATLA